MLKKRSLLLPILTLSMLANPAFAIGCGWYLTVTPIAAQITDTLLTNSIYAVKVADPNILGDFKQQYHLDPDTQLSGYVELGFGFPTCGHNLYSAGIGYGFINVNDRDSTTDNSRNHTGLPVIAPAEFIDITDEASARFATAKTHLKQHIDFINLLLRKQKTLRHCAQLQLFGGVQYFNLKETLHNHYEFEGDIEDVTVTNLYQVNFENKTHAIGPHLGASLFYPLVQGVGVVSEVAGSLLYGESHSSFNTAVNLSPDSTLGETTNLTSHNHLPSSAHFIPALHGKVALGYGSRINCTTWFLELGYRGDRYFNAANDVAYQQLLAGDDINSNSNHQDIIVVGPYASVTLHM